MENIIKLDQEHISNGLFSANNKLEKPPQDRDTLVDLKFPIEGGELACRMYVSSKDAPTLIYYPSARLPLADFDRIALSYNQHDMNIFLMTYRSSEDTGFGVSRIFEDSLAFFDFATGWLAENAFTGAFFVFGESLGSVPAVNTALIKAESVKGMILESPLCETLSFLNNLGLDTQSLELDGTDAFNILGKISSIKTPTLIFHGSKDELISIREAETIQASSGAKTKQFFVIPGAGHDRLADFGGKLYYESIKNFLDTVCGVNTWQQRRRKYRNNGQKS